MNPTLAEAAPSEATPSVRRPDDGPKLQSQLTDPSRSIMRRYADVYVGTPRLLDLIRYEVVTTLFGSMRGAFGLAFRKVFYPGLFKRVGSGTAIGPGLTLRHGGKVELGDRVIIDESCLLEARGAEDSGIVIGDDVIMSRNTALSCKNGHITIGPGVGFGSHCLVHSIGSSHVRVGAKVAIGSYCYFVGGGQYHTDRLDIPICEQGQNLQGGIEIGDGSWLGARVTVLDGVTIGRGAIIGAGAVVTRDVPDFGIAVGVPAKVVSIRSESTDLPQEVLGADLS